MTASLCSPALADSPSPTTTTDFQISINNVKNPTVRGRTDFATGLGTNFMCTNVDFEKINDSLTITNPSKAPGVNKYQKPSCVQLTFFSFKMASSALSWEIL
jgi:hypothetical protein